MKHWMKVSQPWQVTKGLKTPHIDGFVTNISAIIIIPRNFMFVDDDVEFEEVRVDDVDGFDAKERMNENGMSVWMRACLCNSE